MKKGGKVLKLASELEKKLKPHCKKIKIAGSIRRKVANPVDIDIVLIPMDKIKLENFMKTLGKRIQGGEHESTWKIEGVKVELYYAEPEFWGAMLLTYSGKRGSNIGLRIIARKKGFKLNRYGLWKKKKCVAGKTEKGIYEALGRKYKIPRDR